MVWTADDQNVEVPVVDTQYVSSHLLKPQLGTF